MGFQNTRCKIQDRISQQTLLAMLRAPTVIGVKVGESIQWTNENGVTKTYRVYSVKNGVVELELNNEVITVQESSLVSNSTREVFLDKIPLNEWTIDSFDSKAGLVCVTVTSGKIPLHITVKLAR